MIVYNIGKVIGRIAVRLDQDHIIQFRIINSNVSVNFIMKSGSSLCWIILPDHIRNSCRKLFFHFFLRQGKAVLIVNGNFFSLYNLCFQACKALLVAETVIGLSLFNELLGIGKVNPLFLSFRLYIRTYASILIRSFVMDQTCFLQGAVNDLYRSFHITLLIGILNSENEISSFMLCNQIRI